MKTNTKSIIIAGAIAVGLYLLLHLKKILHLTIAQKAAWHDKVLHTMAQMDGAERNRVLQEARRQKAADEGMQEQETRMTPMEMMLALRAAAEEKEKQAEKEQGMGFDYIRERNPPTPAVPVEKKTHTSAPTTKKKADDKKKADEAWDDVLDYIKDPFKSDDKKKAEDKKKADEAWDDVLDHIKDPFKPVVYLSKKKTQYNKPKIIKALAKNKIKYT